jgi:branched-chain amino acid transport system ATP-binding protein
LDAREATEVLLEMRNVRVGYGSVEVLKGVSLQIEKGRVVCLLGANGAGKSTALRAISRLVPLDSGEIYFDGRRIDSLPPHHIVRQGIIQVPEERRLFTEMSVRENLEMGAYLEKDRRKLKESLEEALTIFPALRNKLKQQAGTLSGGEQQMAAIGRALMSKPRLLLMDEPTLGLSPILCEAVMESIVEIKQRGTSLLLSEQNAELALEVSDEGYIMRLGEIVLHGTSQQLMTDERVRKAYLGM